MMLGKLKPSVLVAMVICAVSALGAPAAQAAPEFHCESYPCIGHGMSTDHQFTVNTGTLKCTKNTGATLETTLSATSTTATITPTYPKGNCTCYGVACHLSMNGCTYTVHAQASGFKVSTDISCPAGKLIEIKATGADCTVTIGPQTGLTEISLQNENAESKRDIKATINVTQIHYIEEGLECTSPGTTTRTNGVYEGSLTLLGYQESGGTKGSQQGLWIS